MIPGRIAEDFTSAGDVAEGSKAAT